jgi:MFS family permease
MANSTAILTDVFPSYELGKAPGLSIAVFSVGMIVGPAIGGLTGFWGWID